MCTVYRITLHLGYVLRFREHMVEYLKSCMMEVLTRMAPQLPPPPPSSAYFLRIYTRLSLKIRKGGDGDVFRTAVLWLCFKLSYLIGNTRDKSIMYEKAKCVCFIYMQPQKVKFKYVQINMKHVS